jgi:hypothetical protein
VTVPESDEVLSEAELALRPYMDRLRRAMQKLHATGDRVPNRIVVPMRFPKSCDVMTLWGLPVKRDQVMEPELRFPYQGTMSTWRAWENAIAVGQPQLVRPIQPAFRIVPVYVWSDWAIYHLDPACPGPDPGLTGQSRDNVRRQYWTNCDQAHRSRLCACTKCSSALAIRMTELFGQVTTAEKSRRKLPHLRPVAHARGQVDEADAIEVGDAVDPGIPYGAPRRLGDPRFSNHSAAGWGSAFSSDDPEESLSEPTEDDHDWRGSDRYLD